MSTRCQIGIYDKEIKSDKELKKDWQVLLYRHSDGYPGKIGEGKEGDIGVVPDIMPFVREFQKVRGDDPEYMGACLVTYLKQFHCGHKMEIHSELTVNGISMDYLCAGISKDFHGDIEYYYAITPKEVKVYEVNSDDKFILIETHVI